MPEWIKEKVLQLACRQSDMVPQRFFHIFSMELKHVLTNYEQLLLYISYEKSDLYILVKSKAFLVATIVLR